MFKLKSNERSQMVLNYVGLAKTLAAKFPNLPYEDRFQESCLGLMKAYHTYDPCKNVSFGVYARTVIMNQLKLYYKKEKARFCVIAQRDGERENEEILEQEPAKHNDYNYIELRESLREHLGDFKTKVLIEIANGRTQEECSRIFGISQPSISRLISQAQKACED